MLDGLNSMLEDIGFSIKDSISKIKDTATEAGKTYMASSPYGQAAQKGGAIFGQKTSGNQSRFTPSTSPSSSSPSPSYTPSGTRIATKDKSFAAGLKRGTLRQVLTGKKKVFGIPVLFLGAGVGGFFLYKKLRKRR